MADDELSQAQTNGGTPAGGEAASDDWSAAMAEQAVADAAAEQAAAPPAPPAKPAPSPNTPRRAARNTEIFPSFNMSGVSPDSVMNELDVILDIPVQLSVELGRTKITIKNLLQLAHGSVVELDALAGEPMDVLVNGTLIAQGEVVVVNDKFGIRLTDIITPSERIKKLGR
ncbi:MAG: flagellar motor switch protein FliN [Zoogloeaceae bacterium]|jgi:flagellar motor switch protein FliN/FliY|nr:flagellar motor switch protein FliN [Zoogloeaceae bacterium]